MQPNFKLYDGTMVWKCKVCREKFHSLLMYRQHIATCSMPEVSEWTARFVKEKVSVTL